MESAMESCRALAPTELWSTDNLSERIQKLRDEFWSFYERDFTNEVRPYTTGEPWDTVYAIWSWTNVPEMTFFFDGFASYLKSAAETVALPEGFWSEPLVVRRALFFREVVHRYLPVQILDGELVVGSHFNTAMSHCLKRGEAKVRAVQEKVFLNRWHELNGTGVGNCGAVLGHLIPNYAKVLRKGWQSLQEDARKVAGNPDSSREQMDQARAMVICGDAVRLLTARYAREARKQAHITQDAARRQELLEIAANCRKVPVAPAETFAEALQSLWFTHMLVMAAESYPGPGVSPARIDQYLYPFYQADLAQGRLDRETAKEWLKCLWIKHNYAYDFQGWVGTNQGINASFGQLITLAGIDAEGNDASNDLTYLILEVIEEMNLLEPKPNVRLHQRSPKKLLKRLVLK